MSDHCPSPEAHVGTDAPNIEIWKSVVGYEGIYEVSSFGRVRSYYIHRGRKALTGGSPIGEVAMVLVPHRVTHNYLAVKLWRDNTARSRRVHRMVLDAFVGPRHSGLEAAHFDGNPLNNRLDNLRWATSSENSDDRLRHGRVAIGERNGNAKLTNDIVKSIREIYVSGKVTQDELAEQTGISPSQIWRIVNKKSWDGA